MNKLAKWLLLALTVLCVAACGFYIAYSASMQDNEAPSISFAADTLFLSVQDPRDTLLNGVTALDDRDGNVTASLVVEGISAIRDDQSATVTYAAFDQAGNVAKASRTVQYLDYESPKFSLSAPLVFSSGETADLFQYVKASDLVDGNISNRIKATLTGGETDMSAVGIHEVELRVTNSMGDTARLTVPVEVRDTSEYNATVALSSYLVYIKTGSDFMPDSYLKSLTVKNIDDDIVYTVSELLADGADIDIHSNVQINTPGTYDVTYSVTYDVSFRVSYTGYTKLIVIVEE